jgi:hypothetical protein
MKMMKRTKKTQDNNRNVASLAATTAATLATTTEDTSTDGPRPGVFSVAGGPRQMDDRSHEEEREGHTADIVPLTARNDSSTPHIPAALLADDDREPERDEVARQQDEARQQRDEVARQQDEFARRFQGITVLPAGNEEEVATEATGSSSRNKYIMLAGWLSMITVVSVVVGELWRRHVDP